MTDSTPADVGAGGDDEEDAADGVATDGDVDEDTGVDADSGATVAESDVDGVAETPIAVSEEDGLLPPRAPIEPEAPAPENALFVLLGVLGTVALLATAIFPGVI
jgi:hypothetical protein